MTKKKIRSLLLGVLFFMPLLAACEGERINWGGNDTDTDESDSSQTVIEDVQILNFIPPEKGEKIAVITVKDYGEIKIKLFPDAASKGVENFVGLAEMNYYDELIFHRVIPGFMNQGGDPMGSGMGGKSFWGDKFDGGVPEGLYHFSGAVAYANSQGPTTNGSQFYIVNTEEDVVYYGRGDSFETSGIILPENVKQKYLETGGVPFLDGGYTVFGQVFEGLDLVREIAKVETNQVEPQSASDMPLDKPLKQVLMESVRIIEYQG